MGLFHCRGADAVDPYWMLRAFQKARMVLAALILFPDIVVFFSILRSKYCFLKKLFLLCQSIVVVFYNNWVDWPPVLALYLPE